MSLKEKKEISNYTHECELADDELRTYGLQISSDGYIQWQKDCVDHPRNWPGKRKLYDTLVIIIFELYTTVISTTGASAADPVASTHHVGRTVSLLALTFMYQLGQAVGGLVIPPYSEFFGRRALYIISGAAFSLFSLVIAAVPSISAVFVGRFITGIASAVPSVVIAGSVEDIFDVRRRVWVVLAWNCATTAALCFGPVYGSYIGDKLGWQWIFYSSGACTGANVLLLLAIKESRPSKLLKAKVASIQKETGIKDFKIQDPDQRPDTPTLLKLIIVRPFLMLFTEPIVMVVSVLSAVSWGIIYLFTESLSPIFMTLGLSRTQASLPFLAIAVGILFSLPPRFWDARILKQRRNAKQPVEPEDKMIGFALGAPTLMIGLWWFFWTIPPLVPGLSIFIPIGGLLLIGFAVNEIAYTLSGYLADTYTVYSSSAFAGLAFLRALISGIMPFLGHEIFSSLQANIGGSILAGAATLFALTPIFLFRFSKSLRERSKFAKYSLEVYTATNVDKEVK